MAIAQSLEKERDKALKEVEVKNEVINCLEEKTVEVALALYSLMIDLASNLFFLQETIKGKEEELAIMKIKELGVLHEDTSDLSLVVEYVESPTTQASH